MKKLTIKIAFLLTAAEITFLNGLPPAEPQTKLSTTDARTLGNIYYRLFGNNANLIEVAMKNKWPGGERKKTLEAQRDILTAVATIGKALEDNGPETHLQILLASFSILPLSLLNCMVVGQVLEASDIIITPKTTIDVVINGSIFALQSGEAISYVRLCAIAGQAQGAKIVWRKQGGEDTQPSYEVTAGGYAEPAEGDMFWVTASTPVPAIVLQEGDGPTTHGANT